MNSARRMRRFWRGFRSNTDKIGIAKSVLPGKPAARFSDREKELEESSKLWYNGY